MRCPAGSGGWCSAAAAALQGSTARVAADVDRRQGTAQPSASPNAPDPCSTAKRAVGEVLGVLGDVEGDDALATSCGGCLLWPLTDLQSRLRLQTAKRYLQRVCTPGIIIYLNHDLP